MRRWEERLLSSTNSAKTEVECQKWIIELNCASWREAVYFLACFYVRQFDGLLDIPGSWSYVSAWFGVNVRMCVCW